MNREIVDHAAKQAVNVFIGTLIIIGLIGVGVGWILKVKTDKYVQSTTKLEQELDKYQQLFAKCWDSDTKCSLELKTCEQELQVMRDFINDSEDGKEFKSDKPTAEPHRWSIGECK